MLNLTDCPIHWFSLHTLTLEYSLPQSWGEWKWRLWSNCTGWCSESEPQLDNIRVSNYPDQILTYRQSVMIVIWLSWVTVVSVWSPCTMTTHASNYCHFPHSMDTCNWSHTNINELSVHQQYKDGIRNRLCCYDNDNSRKGEWYTSLCFNKFHD